MSHHGTRSEQPPAAPRRWAAVISRDGAARTSETRGPRVAARRFASGPYAGHSLVEVMLDDPEFVLDAQDPSFDDALRAEADELRKEATHLRVPRAEDGSEVAVFYFRMPDGSYGGMAMVPTSSPLLARYASRAAARTDGFIDLRVPRRIAPDDDRGTALLVHAFAHHILGERLTWREYVALVARDRAPARAPGAPRA